MAPGTHKNIVSVLRCGECPESLTRYFQHFLDMEFCDFNLADWIKGDWEIEKGKWTADTQKALSYWTSIPGPRGRTEQIWLVMQDITNGVAFIHSEKEIHRDLKPINSISQNCALTI
jgi:serine/threonine protein kinase